MRIIVACLLLSMPVGLLAEEPPKAASHFLVEFTVGEAWVKEKPPHEQAFFAEHSANLKRLRTAGRLLLGARYSDKGVIIVTGESVEDVRAEIDKDASVSNGTFKAVVHPFKPFYEGCVERPK